MVDVAHYSSHIALCLMLRCADQYLRASRCLKMVSGAKDKCVQSQHLPKVLLVLEATGNLLALA